MNHANSLPVSHDRLYTLGGMSCSKSSSVVEIRLPSVVSGDIMAKNPMKFENMRKTEDWPTDCVAAGMVAVTEERTSASVGTQHSRVSSINPLGGREAVLDPQSCCFQNYGTTSPNRAHRESTFQRTTAEGFQLWKWTQLVCPDAMLAEHRTWF